MFRGMPEELCALAQALRGDLDKGFDARVRQAFRKGVVDLCLARTWEIIDGLRARQITTRNVRGERREVEGITQSQLAVRVGKNQSSVSRWFQRGTKDWGDFALVLTAIRADFSDLRLPPVRDRIEAGYLASLDHVRHRELNLSDFKAIHGGHLACLEEVYRDWEWFYVQTTVDPKERQEKLIDVYESIVERAKARRNPLGVKNPMDLQMLLAAWGKAWLLTYTAIPVEWSV